MRLSDQHRLSRRRLLQAAGTVSSLALLATPQTSKAQGTTQPTAGVDSLSNTVLTPTSLLPDGAGTARRLQAYQLRVMQAGRHIQGAIAVQPTNGDEERYPEFWANYSKALPHNDRGEVLPVAYNALLAALRGEGDYTQIPLGGDMRLANPQGALAYQLEGPDSHDFVIAAPPTFESQELAGEMLELYWRALSRDVPFSDYGQEELTATAVSDLIHFPYFANWGDQRLFRGETPGDLIGPYISQFLTLPIPYGATTIVQTYRVPQAGDDYMTDYTEWLRCQSGALTTKVNQWDPQPRYLRSGRDLGEYVHQDFSYQAFLNAALILNSFGRPALSKTNPYKTTANQGGFVTFGAPDVLSLVAQVATLALKAAWAQKWLFHRRLRPEMFAGRFHQQAQLNMTYPIHAQLAETQAPEYLLNRWGNLLLSQAYPEGCPAHPAYPGGHATIAGACVTILKAFYDETFIIPNPQFADRDGIKLLPYKNNEALTVGNELDKLAANMSLGRDFAGVHWRSDNIQGLLLGEAVALGLLADVVYTYAEAKNGFELTRFDGTKVTIQGDVQYG